MSNKTNRKLVEVQCDHCGTLYQKVEVEYKRNQKLGRKSFCSRSCTGKAYILKNIPADKFVPFGIGNTYNKSDNLSPFRIHLRRINKRFKEVDIDLEYLKEVWDKQDGICPYSGIKLITPSYKKKNDSRFTASLDRIDSSIGYIKGNIQFISCAINYMKGQMSHEETLEMCKIIAENYQR